MKSSIDRRFFALLLLVSIVAVLALGCAPVTPAAPVATNRPAATSAPAATAAGAPTATLVVPTFVPPTASASTTDLTVFAAASLTESFKEIAAQFEAANPGVKVVYNFGGSNILRAQLEQGARADVFASANTTEMDNARKAGLVGEDAPIFANNRLVVITPSDNPGGVTTLKDLSKPGLKLVVAAKNVPVGNYTLQMLDKMSTNADYGTDFGPTVLKNVVSQEDNVKGVVAKVALGEADAGVVYVSDVTPDVKPKVNALTVPDEFNQIAKYPISVLTEAQQAELARKFVAYVLAKDGGQKILANWNFIPVASAGQ